VMDEKNPMDLLAGTRFPTVEIRIRPRNSSASFVPWMTFKDLNTHHSLSIGRRVIALLRATYRDFEFSLYRAGLPQRDPDQPHLRR